MFIKRDVKFKLFAIVASQNAPNEIPVFDKMPPRDGPGPKMLPDGSEDSKSQHFRLQNDFPELKKRSQNDVETQSK